MSEKILFKSPLFSDRSVFLNMKYCPETMLVQSSYFLAEKISNLTCNKPCKGLHVVTNAIDEVSNGLSLYDDEQLHHLANERQNLHSKINFWLYKTWCMWINGVDADLERDLDGYPSLPRFGTGFYLSIIQKMGWEQLLVESMRSSSKLSSELQEIIATILEYPTEKDQRLFVLLFDTFLGIETATKHPDGLSINKILITALDSLSQRIQCKDIQSCLLKKVIQHLFKQFFDENKSKRSEEDVSLNKCVKDVRRTDEKGFTLGQNKSPIKDNLVVTESRKNNSNESEDKLLHGKGHLLGNGISSLEDCSVITQTRNDLVDKPIDKKGCLLGQNKSLFEDSSKVEQSGSDQRTVPHVNESTLHIKDRKGTKLKLIEIVYELFTKHWTEITHWTIIDTEGEGQLDLSSQHPMHHWYLALYIPLNLWTKDTEDEEKFSGLCGQLRQYVECYASVMEREWIMKGMDGNEIEWEICGGNQDESLSSTGCQEMTSFICDSIEDTLSTAVLRVNENLPGAQDCFHWLLTTEEVFDEQTWLQCIVKNALTYANKEETLMLIDILSMQQQMLEASPETGDRVFTSIKEVIINVYNKVQPEEQDEIITHAFSMSQLSGLNIKDNSIFFNPNCYEHDKKDFLNLLQVIFNKIVDSSESKAFQMSLCDVRKMAIISPYLVLSKILKEAVKFGHANKGVFQVLQEIPSLCYLTSGSSGAKIILESLSEFVNSIKTKQEEKNLITLVQNLLKPVERGQKPVAKQSLVTITEIVQSCVIPNLRLQESTLVLKTTLKLFKSALNALDIIEDSTRAFSLKFLFPIILTLSKHLSACSVSWEGLSPRVLCGLSLGEVVSIRGVALDVVRECCEVILRCFKDRYHEIAGAVQWLEKKVKDLHWTAALYIKPLVDILPIKNCYSLPSNVIEAFGLDKETWIPTTCKYTQDVFYTLFQCCSLSESILHEMNDLLNEKSVGRVSQNLSSDLPKTLCKILSYISWNELSRVISACKNILSKSPLMKNDSAIQEIQEDNDDPSLRTIKLLSSVLRQSVQVIIQPCCSSWATPVIIGNVIKHYVNAVKNLRGELVYSKQSKPLVDDVTAAIFEDICHVICLLPPDVTDPLFILALDVATTVPKQHVEELKQCVAMVPSSVYTASLIQRLEGN